MTTTDQPGSRQRVWLSLVTRRGIKGLPHLGEFPARMWIWHDPGTLQWTWAFIRKIPTPANGGYMVTRRYRLTSITIEPMRAPLSYSRCACWISSSLKVALTGTKIFPSLSHSKSCSRSGAKFFEPRFTPKKVELFASPTRRAGSSTTV